VVRCGLEEDQPIRLLEVPLWMFEPAACDSLRVTESRAVSVDALRALKALLHSVRSSSSDVVVQAQHHCLLPAGGADANIAESSQRRSTSVVSSSASDTPLARAAARCPTEDPATAGTTVAPAWRQAARRQPSRGGVR
jgi:hypothetical protein